MYSVVPFVTAELYLYASKLSRDEIQRRKSSADQVIISRLTVTSDITSNVEIQIANTTINQAMANQVTAPSTKEEIASAEPATVASEQVAIPTMGNAIPTMGNATVRQSVISV